MKDDEMLKRLNEFAKYLDNMESSIEKGKLSRIFTGYMETYKAYQLSEARYLYHFEE